MVKNRHGTGEVMHWWLAGGLLVATHLEFFLNFSRIEFQFFFGVKIREGFSSSHSAAFWLFLENRDFSRNREIEKLTDKL
jgi:hypothetical protein